MSGIWLVNGRCEPCLHEKLDGDGDDPFACGCWCHDTCPDCGDLECGGDCYVLDEDGR